MITILLSIIRDYKMALKELKKCNIYVNIDFHFIDEIRDY